MEQMKSEKSKNFPDLNSHIMNIKGWIRGIHQHSNEE